MNYIDKEKRLLRPKNLFEPAPGKGFEIYITKKNLKIGVLNLMGNVFMKKCDDVFEASKKFMENYKLKKDYDFLIVDFHGEITSEKNAIGHFFDGKATLVVGTHTHIPTNDARVLKNGTAYQTDAGMCGDYDSVIGMNKDNSLNRFFKKNSVKHFPAKGEATLSGVIVDCNIKTGLANKVESYIFGGQLKKLCKFMAGHSHWAGIKHKKGKADKQRSKIFSKLSKEITVAAKLGDKDPAMNPRLRSAIQAARSANMPKDNIERAIDKSSVSAGSNFENLRYEGFGPEKVAVIVETLTDNKNRTASIVRTIFQKAGGSLGTQGSASHNFQQLGVIKIDKKEVSDEKILELAIEAGADECKSNVDYHEIHCSIDEIYNVKEGVRKRN